MDPLSQGETHCPEISLLHVGGGGRAPPSFILTDSLNWQGLLPGRAEVDSVSCVKNLSFSQDGCGFEPWICHLPVVRPWIITLSP